MFEIVRRSLKRGLVTEKDPFDQDKCGGYVVVHPASAAAEAAAGEEACVHPRRRFARRLRAQSLHIRHLDAGSCNACDFEMAALLNPVYDIQRLGFDFVASPRHADIVLVTGAVTRNMELAVRRTYDAMPHPKIVIACGACACNKGAVGDGYAVIGKVADILPVAIELPGCPPRPQDILQALLAAREIYRTF